MMKMMIGSSHEGLAVAFLRLRVGGQGECWRYTLGLGMLPPRYMCVGRGISSQFVILVFLTSLVLHLHGKGME